MRRRLRGRRRLLPWVSRACAGRASVSLFTSAAPVNGRGLPESSWPAARAHPQERQPHLNLCCGGGFAPTKVLRVSFTPAPSHTSTETGVALEEVVGNAIPSGRGCALTTLAQRLPDHVMEHLAQKDRGLRAFIAARPHRFLLEERQAPGAPRRVYWVQRRGDHTLAHQGVGNVPAVLGTPSNDLLFMLRRQLVPGWPFSLLAFWDCYRHMSRYGTVNAHHSPDGDRERDRTGDTEPDGAIVARFCEALVLSLQRAGKETVAGAPGAHLPPMELVLVVEALTTTTTGEGEESAVETLHGFYSSRISPQHALPCRVELEAHSPPAGQCTPQTFLQAYLLEGKGAYAHISCTEELRSRLRGLVDLSTFHVPTNAGTPSVTPSFHYRVSLYGLQPREAEPELGDKGTSSASPADLASFAWDDDSMFRTVGMPTPTTGARKGTRNNEATAPFFITALSDWMLHRDHTGEEDTLKLYNVLRIARTLRVGDVFTPLQVLSTMTAGLSTQPLGVVLALFAATQDCLQARSCDGAAHDTDFSFEFVCAGAAPPAWVTGVAVSLGSALREPVMARSLSQQELRQRVDALTTEYKSLQRQLHRKKRHWVDPAARSKEDGQMETLGKERTRMSLYAELKELQRCLALREVGPTPLLHPSVLALAIFDALPSLPVPEGADGLHAPVEACLVRLGDLRRCVPAPYDRVVRPTLHWVQRYPHLFHCVRRGAEWAVVRRDLHERLVELQAKEGVSSHGKDDDQGLYDHNAGLKSEAEIVQLVGSIVATLTVSRRGSLVVPASLFHASDDTSSVAGSVEKTNPAEPAPGNATTRAVAATVIWQALPKPVRTRIRLFPATAPHDNRQTAAPRKGREGAMEHFVKWLRKFPEMFLLYEPSSAPSSNHASASPLVTLSPKYGTVARL